MPRYAAWQSAEADAERRSHRIGGFIDVPRALSEEQRRAVVALHARAKAFREERAGAREPGLEA